MVLGRTSIKLGLAGLILLVGAIVALSSAEGYYQRATLIKFSAHGFRPWNHFDYLGWTALFMALALFGSAIMFHNKDD